MPVVRARVLMIALLAATPGCSTVTVFSPASSVVSLTDQQSRLHDASEAYCANTREMGLATGEASLGALAAVLTGKGGEADAYWRMIEADSAAPGAVMIRIRSDLDETASGLSSLDRAARDMMQGAQPSKDDVATFERALIHARQARNSLSDAIAQVNLRIENEIEPGRELAPLDRALASARATADDLAAARTAAEVARVKAAVSAS